jgi:hypothetical protein
MYSSTAILSGNVGNIRSQIGDYGYDIQYFELREIQVVG